MRVVCDVKQNGGPFIKKKGRQTELLVFEGSAKNPILIKVSRTPPFICIR